jgi:hypothetical protein
VTRPRRRPPFQSDLRITICVPYRPDCAPVPKAHHDEHAEVIAVICHPTAQSDLVDGNRAKTEPRPSSEQPTNRGAVVEQSGRNPAQPTATRSAPKSTGNAAETLRSAAPGRRRASMVRRGSTVRVRQRALQNPSRSALLRSARLAQSRTLRWVWSRQWSFRVENPGGYVVPSLRMYVTLTQIRPRRIASTTACVREVTRSFS